jgi:DNA-binding CsgD family transcriptional regulator
VYARQNDPGILFRQLLQSVGYPSIAVASEGSQNSLYQVVFETEVDGIKFTVTCAHLSPHSTNLHLSPREQEITNLIIKGMPNKTIAALLKISRWTVGTYIKRIFAKLGVNTRAELVAKVLQENLLEETDTVIDWRSIGMGR